MQIYLAWLEIPCIGIYSGLFRITWFQGFGSTSRAHTQYNVKASNRLGSDNQESNNGHNHVHDKTKLTVFWDKHMILRMTAMLSRKCSKKIVETHPISKRLALRRGKQGFNMC